MNTTTLTAEVETLADLRRFIAMCDRAEVGEDAALHVKTRFAWDTAGARLTRMTAVKEDPA